MLNNIVLLVFLILFFFPITYAVYSFQYSFVLNYKSSISKLFIGKGTRLLIVS